MECGEADSAANQVGVGAHMTFTPTVGIGLGALGRWREDVQP